MSQPFKALFLVTLAAFLPSALRAEETVLTVSGIGEPREYDRAALADLGAVEMTTSTIWTDGQQSFKGVPLSVILSDLGVTEGTIKARALNDYSIDIPAEEVLGQDWPIIAYLLNGANMSVREKGPLWLVYPYDSDPAYKTEVIYSRSIWQLDRLEIEN